MYLYRLTSVTTQFEDALIIKKTMLTLLMKIILAIIKAQIASQTL